LGAFALRLFCFGAFGLLLLAFWWGRLFGCGRLLEGNIAGGRLLKGGNEWLKGEELLKENC
jgi:hypothetical protein